ncbi:hypothetical protein K491DRAFT_385162 [Lophiostoma macrostomum CBS 122681]|uniref:Hydrophobin n=1 Tax=Lophiostoma macrostomum CBS 122681 TaxID=1314788 RepID=A0A6A6TPP0_9PLEO|nr:hypothetical protein K491DRAFT_385162 [Lophiostoma macrostomum CBS 122681]
MTWIMFPCLFSLLTANLDGVTETVGWNCPPGLDSGFASCLPTCLGILATIDVMTIWAGLRHHTPVDGKATHVYCKPHRLGTSTCSSQPHGKPWLSLLLSHTCGAAASLTLLFFCLFLFLFMTKRL